MDIKRVFGLATYVLSFSLGRGALFIAPFILANYMQANEYGALETALAGAAVLAGLATLGTASATPLVLLGHNSDATLKGVVTHHIALVAALAAFIAGGSLAHLPPAWLFTALLTAGLALQGLASTHLKTLGQGNAAVMIDAGLLGLMALAALAAYLLKSHSTMVWLWSAAGSYCLIMSAAYLRILANPKHKHEAVAWQNTLMLGAPLMLGGLVSQLATTSGRLGMGLLAPPSMTGEYAVLARASTLPIVAHQLILIARFRNLFALPENEVERAILQIVVLVGTSAAAFMVLSPRLGWVLGPAFARAFDLHQTACMWIIAQAVLWSAIALNDLVIARHQVTTKVLPYTASALLTFLMIGWIFLQKSSISLERFAFIHGAVMILFYIVQFMTMRKLGIRYTRTFFTTLTMYLIAPAAISMAH